MLPEDYLPGLRPILETAMKQSPQMLLRQIEIARHEARVLEADYERWPQVGGNFRLVSNKTSATQSATSRDSGLFYSLAANQALFHWGAIRRRGEIARIQVAIAEKNYAEAYRSLALQIRQAYLDLVARHAGLRGLRHTVGIRQTELDTVRQRHAMGSSSPAEVAGLELRLNEEQLELDRLEAEFDAGRRRLSRLAGISPDVSVDQIPYDIPMPRFDAGVASELLAGVLRDAGKGSFRAQVAELRMREADLNYRIARVRLLPRINALAGHSRESSTNASATQVSQVAITRDSLELRGEWNIFDGFATRGYKLEAKADRRSWERQRDIEAEAVMDDAQRLSRVVGIEARSMQLAEQRRQGAAHRVSLAEEDLKTSGRASEANVNEAVRDLRTAEWNAAITRANFLIHWSEFVSVTTDDPVLNALPSRYARATR